MKNKTLLRIFALLFSLVLLVSCFVISPSADSYDDNLTHYWLYLTHDHAIDIYPYDLDFRIAYDTPFKQKCTYIYYRLPNGQNLFTHRTFNKLLLQFHGYNEYDDDEIYGGELVLSVFFDITDLDYADDSTPLLEFVYLWGAEYQYDGLLIRGYNLHPDYPYVEFPWKLSYGNYNLQFWLDNNYITNLDSTTSFGFPNTLNDFFRYTIISHGKTYTEGYNSGVDFGLEEGYNNGYDQGSINGYQQGYTDGDKEGHRVGYEEGYGFGFEDGNEEGYELGKDVGYDNGYDDAKAVYDTTEAWQDMKSLIFAIFDAPFYVISYSLDFDLFGINVAGTLIALISTALIVWILKIIIVKLF